MTNPLVSIIVPIYGVEKYIAKCAESLCKQNYRNIEIIFVNDCTKDDSIEVLRQTLHKYAHQKLNYKIVEHKVNRGLSAARNTGVAVAQGSYIMHIDSDDWIAPSMVECLVNKATESVADIVICGCYNVRQSNITQTLPFNHKSKDDLVKDILFKSVPGSMWAKLIAKKIYDDHADAWSIEGINHGEDYATMPRLLYYAKKIAYVDEALYYYNLLNQSSYTHSYTEKSVNNMLKADRVLYDFFKDKYDEMVLDLMKLRTKTGIIKGGNSDVYCLVKKQYVSEQKRSGKYMPKRDKLLLMLCGKGFDKLLAYAVRRYLNN